MREVPGQFNGAEPFRLKFNMRESREGTEEKPVLFYERNGFTFRADLDVIANTAKITLEIERPESLDKDWQVLLGEVQELADEELDKRHDSYSQHFA